MNRNVVIAVTALAAGVFLGHFLRNSSSVSPHEIATEADDRNASRTRNDQKLDSRPARPRRHENREEITFSRLQWSKLLRNPSRLRISILGCLDFTRQLEASVPVVNGIPVVGRLFEGKQKPDLSAQADFFGWDEPESRTVRQALVEFGDQLAEAEKSGVRVEYLSTGGLRFDFSASQATREELAAKLKEKLDKILGPKDAERFAVLSGMEGLSKELPVVYEIQKPPPSDIIFSDPDHPEEKPKEVYMTEDGKMSPHPELDPRFRHLATDFEWDRACPPASNSLKK